MDLETEVNTQRDALLRFLARWIVVFEVLSSGRLALGMPRWFGLFVSSLLDRAEAAAGYLVIVSARVLVARVKGAPGDAWHAAARSKRSRDLYRESVAAALGGPTDGDVSCDSLYARMKALKEMLANLPRRALRLLKRCAEVGPEARRFADRVPDSCGVRGVLLECQRLAPRAERPPDGG